MADRLTTLLGVLDAALAEHGESVTLEMSARALRDILGALFAAAEAAVTARDELAREVAELRERRAANAAIAKGRLDEIVKLDAAWAEARAELAHEREAHERTRNRARLWKRLAKRLFANAEFFTWWHGIRERRLFVWAHSELTSALRDRYFSIVANGSASHDERREDVIAEYERKHGRGRAAQFWADMQWRMNEAASALTTERTAHEATRERLRVALETAASELFLVAHYKGAPELHEGARYALTQAERALAETGGGNG